MFVYSNLGDKSSDDHIFYDLYPDAEDFIENCEGETSTLDAPGLQTVITSLESETIVVRICSTAYWLTLGSAHVNDKKRFPDRLVAVVSSCSAHEPRAARHI